MADTLWLFQPVPAITTKGELLAAGTEGIIYGTQADAEAGTNPLPLYDASGTPRSSTVKVADTSVWEGFAAYQMEAWWVSGDIVQYIQSQQAAIVGATAVATAEQASEDASNALTIAQNASAKVDQAVTVNNGAIDDHLGGDATGLVQTVAGKADLDPDTAKLRESQLPDVARIFPASSTKRGVVKLVGDLGGTADSPTVPKLAGKANDSTVVHNTGAETVAGRKTFLDSPVVPDASFTIAKTAGLQDALDTAGGSADPALGGVLTGTASAASYTAGSITDAAVAANAGIAESKIANLPSDLAGKVPTSRTVNGQPLTGDVSITAGSLGAVPDSRTVNGNPLSADVTLDAGDVSALPVALTGSPARFIGIVTSLPTSAADGDLCILVTA